MQYYAATAGGGAMAVVFKEKDKPANHSQVANKRLKNKEKIADVRVSKSAA